MRGRRPDLNKSNVATHPAAADQEALASQNREQAISKAKELKPRGLSGLAGRIWNDLAPDLYLLGRLKSHFVPALEQYCRISARLRDAEKTLDKDEWTYVTTGRHGTQEKARPMVAQLNDDWRKWRSLTASFGLTPADERSMASNQLDMFDDGFDV